ncbi:MAG: DUF72 domain-containing protein [bacterium]
MAELRIGTCSWKYDSWAGLVYTEIENINYLQKYSYHYNTVEVDQWFWSLGKKSVSFPKPADVKDYKNSVPDNFKFTIKMPNSITLTHPYQQKKGELLERNEYFLSCEILNQFLKSIEPLKEKLGPLMFQFEYLNKQKMASQFDFMSQFSAFIQNAEKDYPYAVETRNPNYLNKDYFEFINDNNLIHVFLQGYYMPAVYETYKKFKDYINGTTVIRLHGPDRKGMEERTGGDWSRIIEPRDGELEKIIEMIIDLLGRNVDVYLNVNNHYEGSAPLTIKKINDMIAAR